MVSIPSGLTKIFILEKKPKTFALKRKRAFKAAPKPSYLKDAQPKNFSQVVKTATTTKKMGHYGFREGSVSLCSLGARF
jgi:hypothetical protein